MSFDAGAREATTIETDSHPPPEGIGAELKALRKAMRGSPSRMDRFLAATSDKVFRAMFAAPKEAFCYLIQADSGPVKIGWTVNPPARLCTLQQATYEPLWLLAYMPGAVAVERLLHAEFSADRIRGEWFYPSLRLYGRFGDLCEAAEIAGLEAGCRKEARDPRYVRREFDAHLI